MLFLRFAEYLQRYGIADCVLVDYQDGFMAKNVKHPEVKVLEYAESGDGVLIPDGSIAIFQSMTPWSIFPGLRFGQNVRFLFWNCHPFNLIPTLPGFRQKMQRSKTVAQLLFSTVLRRYASKMRRFVELLSESSALVFMDTANLEVTEELLGVRIDEPAFVPVAMEGALALDASTSSPEQRFDEGIRVTWLGRITDFKYYPLIKCLEDLNALQPVVDVPISVICVGAGDYERALDETVESLTNLSVRMVRHLAPEDIPDFLESNTDLLIGMGTSALEAARLGIPALLLDASYGPLSSTYSYKFLYEQEGFTLASVMMRHTPSGRGATLVKVLEKLTCDFSGVSQKTKDYFASNHEIGKCAKKLADACSTTRLTYRELASSGLLSRSLAYRLLVALRTRFQ